VVGLALLQILLGFAVIPFKVLPFVDLGLEMLYLAAPVFAIYRAANAPWTKWVAAAFLGGGILMQAVGLFLAIRTFHGVGLAAGICTAFSQVGLQTWCVGLGALLATSIREKNILIPVAIFLAIFDMFLVLTPVGPTQAIMRHAPSILTHAGLIIPRATASPTGGVARIVANVGPADLVFLGAYFIALFRFKMRTRITLLAMIPTLIGYMFVVLFGHIALPALLPIGVVLLAVNWKEFNLTKDEKLSSAAVAALGVGLLVWGVTRPRPAPERQPGPGPTVGDQGSTESQSTPGKAGPGLLPSSGRSAPADTPSPQ
jgi:hypothetical protein